MVLADPELTVALRADVFRHGFIEKPQAEFGGASGFVRLSWRRGEAQRQNLKSGPAIKVPKLITRGLSKRPQRLLSNAEAVRPMPKMRRSLGPPARCTLGFGQSSTYVMFQDYG
jgi:hypothetical protein